MTGPAPAPIGIVAGGGSLPGEVADAVIAHGGRVHIAIVDGAGTNVLTRFPHTRVHWSKLGHATRALKQAGVHDVLLLGTFARPRLRSARPDLAFLRELPAIVRLLRAGGDDALLRALIALFERQGFHIVGVADVAPGLLAAPGALTRATPSDADQADIDVGSALIAALGPYDIGQAVVVNGDRIEAIEGAEGTDRMLGRVQEQRRRGRGTSKAGVLVKCPKPGQDLRVDLPAIGPETVRNAEAAGLRGIAVMRGHVLLADRDNLVARADEAGLFVTGVERNAGVKAQALEGTAVETFGHVAIPEWLRDSAAKGVGAIAALARFEAAGAIVVHRGRVLSIGANEPAASVIMRSRTFLHSKMRARQAVVVLGATQDLTADLVNLAAEIMFAGIVVPYDTASLHAPAAKIIAQANSSGLFVGIAPLVRQERQT